MSSLKKIKTIKHHKLEVAERELSKVTREIKTLKARLQEIVEEHQNYKVWRIGEEERLYARVQKQLLRVNELDKLRERAASMREQESKQQQNILDHERQLQSAQDRRLACQQSVHRHEKELEKYDLLIAQGDAETAREEERLADEILDEFSVTYSNKVSPC